MANLAFLTTGPLSKPIEDPQNANYGNLAFKIWDEVAIDEAYLGHSGTATHDTWGKWTIPKMYQGEEYKGRILQTLSLWKDLESLYAFSYHGLHAQALKRRDEWFPRIPLPNHVAWWVADDHRPTWGEGAKLYDRIAVEGSSPEAFNLRQAYDANGEPAIINREIIKSKARLYTK